MGVNEMIELRRLLFAAVFAAASVGARAAPTLVLWDSAVISSPEKLAHAQPLELIYATQPLQSGQLITTFVPLGKSYRVMCCLKIKDGQDLTLTGVEKTYSYDPDFVTRVRAIKGARYVYVAEFLPLDQMNKHMKSMAASAGETYYSAFGLVGSTGVDKIKGTKFDWNGYGTVSLETLDAGKHMFHHKLTTSSDSVVIEEPALPD